MSSTTDYSRKAMLVTLKISKWTAQKKDQRITNKVLSDNGAAATSGRFTKVLIDKAAFEAMNAITNEARAYHDSNTLPWDGDGRRVLSSALFMDYRQRMSEFESRYAEAVREFLHSYPDYIDAARTSLNGMFDHEDYPSFDELQSKFSMGITPEPVPTGNSLHIDIATEYLDEQRAVIEAKVTERMQTAHRAIYDRLLEAVQHMHKQLEDGVQFRNATIDNIVDICDLVPNLSIEDDARLKDLAVKAKAAATRFSRESMLNNVTDAKLTKNELARQVKAIEDQMSGFFG